MKKQKSASPQTRLSAEVRAFVDAQVYESGRNKGKPYPSDVQKIEEASKKLGKGWGPSSIMKWLGHKSLDNPDSLPQGGVLFRFCAVTGISSDWLFFGTGPRLRTVSASGGTLTETELTQQVSSYVTGRLGMSELLRRFPVEVSGSACLERLVAIAKAEEDAEAGLLAVSDAANEAFDQVRRLRIEDALPETPAVLALQAIVAERATLANEPIAVSEPRLLQTSTSADETKNRRLLPSKDFALVLQSSTEPSTRRSTSEFLMAGQLLGSPRAKALIDLARSRQKS